MSKLKVLLALLLLCFPVLGQGLSIRRGSDAARNAIISAQILHEGSFELQQRTNLASNWDLFANFNAFPGTNYYSISRTNHQRYYRLVRLHEPPSISIQPIGVTNLVNQPVQLEAAATGSWPLRYQWFRNGQAVPGATSNKLVFNGSVNLSGTYTLAVTNLWGAVVSSNAVVKSINTVPTTLADKKIRYVIKGAQGAYFNSGTFDTTYFAQGHYTTVSSFQALNDGGNWQYGTLPTPGVGRVLLTSFFLYPSGAVVDLTFTNTTGGTFNLQELNRPGRQFGEFTFIP